MRASYQLARRMTSCVALIAVLSASCGREPGTQSTPTPTQTPTTFYVTPTASSSGDGSPSRPWRLATALASSAVRPGDTIWVRGGTYQGEFVNWLNGTANNLIVVRQYPGERATIKGNLIIQGSYVAFWGLEIVNQGPSGPPDLMGVNVRAPGTKLINLVVHDHSGTGVGFWMEAPDAELYGCIIYNNGWQEPDRGHGHNIYSMNLTGRKRIVDNILFNPYYSDLQVYASDGQYIQHYHIEGNAMFNAGTLSSNSQADEFMIGGATPAADITLTNNYTYRTDGEMTADLGWYWGQVNQDLTLTNNYFVGMLQVMDWVTARLAGNTVYSTRTMIASRGNVSGHTWSGNAFFGNPVDSAWQYDATRTTFTGWKTLTGLPNPGVYVGDTPTGVKVVVRPNHYEPGRANIIVYNWAGQSSVSVDPSGVLAPGDHYEVKNVQDFWGSAVASGIHSDGRSIDLPMTGMSPPPPIGGFRDGTPPVTGPRFNVFVLLRTP